MGKELVNGRECKMAAKNAVVSIFKVNQTKYSIVFINSKLTGKYKKVRKDAIFLLH